MKLRVENLSMDPLLFRGSPKKFTLIGSNDKVVECAKTDELLSRLYNQKFVSLRHIVMPHSTEIKLFNMIYDALIRLCNINYARLLLFTKNEVWITSQWVIERWNRAGRHFDATMQKMTVRPARYRVILVSPNHTAIMCDCYEYFRYSVEGRILGSDGRLNSWRQSKHKRVN